MVQQDRSHGEHSLVLLLVIAPPFQELESLGSGRASPPKLTVFFRSGR